MRARAAALSWLLWLGVSAGAWAQMLPAERTTLWNPGIPGGIPLRTTVCATVDASTYGDGAQDASAGIQAAINACPAGRVVLLSAGTFTVNNYLLIHRSITLRGAGATATILTKTNGAHARLAPMQPVSPASYSYDPQPVIIVGPQRWPQPDSNTSQPLTADGAKGAFTVTVADASGFAAGQFVLLDERSGATWQPTPAGFPGPAPAGFSVPQVWQGDRVAWNMHLPTQTYQDDNVASDASGPFDWTPGVPPASMSWFSRTDRPINEIKEIASVTGSTITFTTPLHIGYRTSHTAQLTGSTGANVPVTYAGIEHLAVVGGADGQIRFEHAAYSWAKSVENTQWIGEGFAVNGSFRIEIRDSYLHDASWPEPGGAGYAISFARGTSEVLVENNIVLNACKIMVVRSSGAGSVFGYNYTDDSWNFDNPGWVEVGLNASHMAGPHHVLFEGNYASNADSDYTHGNAIYLTFFRNWLTGQRQSFTDLANRRAVGLAYGSWWDSVVGNVLGRPGQMSGWVYDDPAMAGNAPWSDKVLWKLGYDPERWTMAADPQTLATLIRGGNFDFLTTTVHWENLPAQPLPESLYLSAKPAFFGNAVWPWVDPASATPLHSLPAKARYDAGTFFAEVPTIVAQPASVMVASGQSATLDVTAFGTGPLTYQWYAGASGTTTTPIAGATADTFTTPPLSSPTSYWVQITNAYGTAPSATAAIEIGTLPPTVVTAPQSQTIPSGQPTPLSVIVTGTVPFTFQWYEGASGVTSVPIAGATASAYMTPALTSATSYWVRVSNAYGTAESAAATLTIGAPRITTQPASQPINPGQPATLSVVASGPAPLSYQWYVGPSGTTAALLSGAATATYTTPPLVTAASYWVRVTNAYGSADSATATISIGLPPTITTPPQSQTIGSGQTATVSVAATTGTSVVTYQWYMGPSGTTTSPLAGANGSTFTTPPLTATTSYWVRVTNPFGMVDSAAATVGVDGTPIAFVQVNAATPASASTVAVPFTGAQTTGDTNVVVVGWSDSTRVVTSVTDTQGHTYLRAVGPTSFLGTGTQSIYYATPIASASANENTVTVTFDGATPYPDVRIAEYGGIEALTPVDGVAAASGSSTLSDSGPVVTTAANDLLVAGTYIQTLSGGPGTGFTARLITYPDSDILEDRVVGGAGPYHATAPVTPTGGWIMQVVAFRATSWTAAPTIVTPPASLTIAPGHPADLHVGAVGTVPLGYQWYVGASGTTTDPIAGATSSVYTTPALAAPASYWVRVTNVNGHVDSATATITVGAIPPTIAAQPQSTTIVSGHTAPLSVAAAGTFPFAYQWYRGSSGTTTSPIGGATAAHYTTPALSTTTSYWVRVSNAYGVTDSATASVAVDTAPTIVHLTPARGLGDTLVTITGWNFGAAQGTSTVTFNGTVATPTAWSTTSIGAPVPAGATSGPVVVTVGDTPSTGVPFTVEPVPTPTLVQHVASSANPVGIGIPGNAFRIPLPNPVGAGNALILGLSYPWGTSVVITDSTGNPWPASPAVSADPDAGGYTATIWVLPNARAGATTLTVTLGGPVIPFQYTLSEFTHVATVSPVNGTSHTAQQTGGSPTTGSFVPGDNDDNGGHLIWSYFAIAWPAAGNPSRFSPGPGFTLLDADIAWNTLQGFPHASEYVVQRSSSPINPGITPEGDTTNYYNGVSVALKAAEAGTPPPAGIRIVRALHMTSNIPSTPTWSLQVPSSGNLIALVTNESGVINIAGVTDSQGNAYTKAQPNASEPQIWFAGNADSDGNLKLTLDVAHVTATATVVAYDIAGAAAFPLDVVAGVPSSDANNASVLTNAPSITPTTANGLVLASVVLGQGPGLEVTSPAGAIWDLVTYSGEMDRDLMENADAKAHVYHSTTATLDWNWTITPIPDNNYAAVAVAFKSAAAEGESPAMSSQPVSQTVAAGTTATLSVTATGTAPLSYQWYVGASGTTSAPISGATSASYTTPALISDTSYWVRVANAYGQADSTTATVTIGVAPAITSEPAGTTIASGTTATLSVVATGTPPLTYQWYVGSSGVTTNPVTGATGSGFTTPALSATTSYWVRVSNAFGQTDSATVAVTIGVAPVITSEPAGETIASGQTATLSVVATGTLPLTYQWYVGSSGTTASPIAGATAASYTTPALTSAGNYWVRVSNAYGQADSTTATVSIGAAPVVTAQPAGQIILSGTTASLGVTATGAAPLSYQWYVGSSGTTTSPVPGATGSSFTTPALGTTTSYWVRVSNAYGAVNSATATVLVVTPPAITAGPTSQVIVSGTAATLSVTATGTGPLIYQWYIGASGTTTGLIEGATDSTFTTPPLTAATSYWVRIASAYGSIDSEAASIDIGSAPAITAQPASPTVAGGATVILGVTAEGFAPLTYQWYVGSTGTTTDPIEGATGASFTTPALVSAAAYWVRVTNPYGSTDSATAEISIGVPPAVSAPPTSQIIASGATATLTVVSTGTLPITYQWYAGPSGTTTSPIGGATTSSFTTPPLTSAASYWVRVMNAYGTADSTTATVTIGVAPAITSQPANETIVSGQTAALSVVGTGTTPLTYQWYVGTSDATNAPIAGATASSYTTPPLTTESHYWVRVINSYGAADSATAIVTIGAGPAFTTQPSSQTVGSGQSASLSVIATGDAPLSYQWYLGASGTTTSPVAGAIGASFTTPALTTDTNYWVRATNPYGSADSTTAAITIGLPPTITTPPQSPTVTAGHSANLSLVATGTAPLSYQWYVGATGTIANPIAGAIASSYTTPELTDVTSFWVRVTNAWGSADSPTVTIGLAPEVSAAPESQTIASGQTATVSVAATGTPPLSYQWFAGPSGTTTDPIADAVGTSYTTPTLSSEATYWVRVTNAFGTADSTAAVISIGEAPAITAPPLSQTIAAGQTAALSVVAIGTAPLTYQWFEGTQGQTANPVPGATTNAFFTPPLLTTTSYWVRVTNAYGTADSATAVLAAAPGIVTQPSSAIVAPGHAVTLSVTAIGAAPLSYQWYVGTSGTTTDPIAGANANVYTTPALSTPVSYWVRVVNAHGAADSATATVTVGVVPPTITVSPQSQTIASGQAATLVVTANGTVPFTYQWYVGPSGTTSSPIAGAVASSYTTPALTSQTSYWARVTNAYGSADSAAAVISIGEGPAITTAPANVTIIAGQTATFTVAATGTAPLSYQWYLGVSGNTTSPVAGATGASFTTPSLTSTTSYWVRVSNAYGSVDSIAASASAAPAVITQPAALTVAAGQTASLSVGAVGSVPLSYQWYLGAAGTTTNAIPGATGSSYVSPVLTTDATYWVRVSNGYGTADSNAAVVGVKPAITTGPQNQTIASGQSATLTVSALGTPPLTYQWYSGTSGTTTAPISGATGATFTTAALTAQATYWVRVSNARGTADSSTATVGIGTAPAITANPLSQIVKAGETASLSITATGSSPLAYQWYSGPSGSVTAPIAGAIASSFTTPALTTTTMYWARVTNTYGSADSAAATIGVSPHITIQPASPQIPSGQTAVLSVVAIGSTPLTYQWFSGPSGTTTGPIAGATGATYVTPALTAPASFWVRVTNSYGTEDSLTATVNFSAPFTDDPLVAGVTSFKVVHIAELRTRIDALRAMYGLQPYAWEAAPLVPGAPLLAVYVTNLRTALQQVYGAAHATAPIFSDPDLASGATPVRAAHISEVRTAILMLEANPTPAATAGQ